jgi:hypothetical protein
MRDLSIEVIEPTLVLTATEIISIFKSVLIECADIDLDKLEVYSIIKYSNNRLHITLDMDLLRENSAYLYYDTIQIIKKMFSPYIFTVNTALDVNILINKLFTGYEYYRINEDMTIEIYY